jgi:peptide/nickel transport system substrate-binding protein
LTAALLAVLIVATAACGSDKKASSSSNGSSASQSATVSPANFDTAATLRAASTVGNRTYDPQKPPTCAGEYWTLSLVYARLINLNASLKLEPMLATSWDFVDSGTALQLKLRTDVKFRDGSAFDASVVKSNLDRAKTLDKSTLKADVSSIDSVEVVDPATVKIHLVKGQGAQLPYFLAQCAGMILNPAAFTKPDLDQTGDGLGPYVVKAGSFQAGKASALVPGSGTWWGDPALSAHFAEIDAQSVDDATAVNLLKSGQLDIINTAGAINLQAKQAADAGTIQFVPYETYQGVALALNIKNGALQNVKVRQAMNRAIDRQGIAQAVFQGECSPTVQPAIQNGPGYDASLETAWSFDLNAAKALLQQASYDGSAINAIQHTVTAYAPVNEALQAEFKALGLNYVLGQPLSSTDAIPQFLAGTGDTFGFPLLQAVYPTMRIQDSIDGRYTVKTTTDAIKAAGVGLVDPSLTEAQRNDAATKANKQIVQDSTIIPICTVRKGVAGNKNLVNLDKNAEVKLGSYDLLYVGKKKA